MTKAKTSGASTAKEQARTTAETVKDTAERTGLAAPSASEVEKARAEGVKEAIKQDAKESYEYATDGALPGDDPAPRQFTGSSQHTNMVSGLLGLSPEGLADAIAEDADTPIPEEAVANLLEQERSGQNRTPYVEALCKRLKVKSPYEVTNAGPGYTNDVSNVTPVARPGE